jgi:hypothetical protein
LRDAAASPALQPDEDADTADDDRDQREKPHHPSGPCGAGQSRNVCKTSEGDKDHEKVPCLEDGQRDDAATNPRNEAVPGGKREFDAVPRALLYLIRMSSEPVDVPEKVLKRGDLRVRRVKMNTVEKVLRLRRTPPERHTSVPG